MATDPTTIGRYEVECQLGEGGMGAVYLAKDPTIGRRVAIKVLRTDDDEYRKRFKLEVTAAGALRHRNIITIFDSGEHSGSPFLAMEYVPGETLGQKIARREQLPLSEKLRLVAELCDGLAHAHRSGIVHRDIKPANVIVDDEDGAVKIVDFGIARVAAAVGTTVTKSGMMVGTLTYMAPEQIVGKPVDHRADMFAVGCVLYELVSFKAAFPGGLDDGLMYRIVHEEPAPLATLVPGLDAEVIAIADRALRKDPAERFAQIKEMSTALTAVRQRLLTQAAQVTLKRPVSPAATPSPVTAEPRRASWRTAAVVALAVLVAGAGLWVWLRARDSESAPARPAAEEVWAGGTRATGRPVAPAGTSPAPVPAASGGDTAPPPTAPTTAPLPPIAAKAETRLRLDAPPDVIATLDDRAFTNNSIVTPGTHTLVVRRPRVLGSRREQLEIGEGQTRTVAPDLSVGTLIVGTLPFPFASVTVDGQPISGRTSAFAGPLVAEFVPAAGSSVARRRVTLTLTSNAERDLSELLPRGRLRFEITPAADVTIDTRAFGTVTEGSLGSVAVGEYPIRIQRRGYPDFAERVQVTAGPEQTIRFAYNFATGSWVRR